MESEDDFKPDAIDVDEDDDDDFMANDDDDDIDLELKEEEDDGGKGEQDHDEEEEPIVEKPKKKRSAPVKKEATPTPKTTPKKAAPKSTLKKEPAAPSASAGGKSADEVLALIPDAVLPEQDPEEAKKGFNFFKKAAAAPGSSGDAPEIPEAQPNCLSGLTIVFTGVLPTLDRDASENLAKKYGAKVTKSILGKTSLVVIGDEAGPSKVAKIKKLKIKAIDEDGFVKLLTSMPAEGGDGEAALKAKEKREEEERRVFEQAEKEAEEEEKEAKRKEQELKKKKAQTAAKAAASSSANSGLQRLPEEPQRIIPESEKLWTVKYAPKDLSQLCGNKGQILKLKNWLNDWFDNAKSDFKNPGKDGSGIFRAALISGPPGIGKTSAAHLIANSLGFDVLEKNASDVRSKSLLNSNIKSVLNNTSVVGFFKHRDDEAQGENDKKFCLIMDEVDGMSSGDHGGAGALLAFCRITKMPMILICNDKSLPKMRIFDRVTFDLPFRRPSENEVKSRLMTIALREKVKLDPTVIGQLVGATNNDIRQMINLLSTVSKTQKVIGSEQTKDLSSTWKKETILKPFDITLKFLNGQIYSPNSKHTLNDKINLYFNDIDFTPLMIQENYLYTRPTNVATPAEHLERVALAADDISQSDHINSLIRSSEQQWSLLPFHAVMSSVKPSLEIAGTVNQRINFAGWLGQNSKAMKYERLLQELQYHTRLRTFSDKKSFRLDYIPLFIEKLTEPILKYQDEGIESVIDIMDYYYLTKEDWDSIVDFGVGPLKSDNYLKKISTKTKTTFTRKYNASSHPTAIYKTGNSVTGRGSGGGKQKVDYEDVIEDDTTGKDEQDDEEVDDDKIDAKKDKLIKEVKSKKKAAPKKKK